MGLLSRAFQSFLNYNMEDPSQPLVPPSYAEEVFSGRGTDAGVTVNERTAMSLSAVYSSIKIISEDLGSLPLVTYSVEPDGISLKEARDKSIYRILHDQPNEFMTSVTFRSALLASCLGWGAGFAYITRDKAARVVSLNLLSPAKTAPVVVEGKLRFATTQTPTGAPAFIDAENMIHIVGTTLDGITGISPIMQCKNTIGLSLATESFGARFFANSAVASGVYTIPGVLDTEAYERLKTALASKATGGNAHKPMILEGGLSWTQTSIPNESAQFLSTRILQVTEICRIFRIPPHLLQELTRSTNNNIEQQSLEYRVFTLAPWAVRLEQEFTRKLLPASSNLVIEHDFSALTRGDFASQTAGINVLRNTGVYSANDGRRQLRMNPIPASEGGDLHLAPVNYISLSRLTDPNYTPAGELPEKTKNANA